MRRAKVKEDGGMRGRRWRPLCLRSVERIYGLSVSSHQSIEAHSKDNFVSLCNLYNCPVKLIP